MAILANKNGQLISVVATDKPNVWKENCPKGSTFTIRPTDKSVRKVFDGPNAVAEAQAWIEQVRRK
jgi:hypothetical protein